MRHFEPYSPFATDGLGALDYHFDTRSQPGGCTMIGRTLSVLIGKRFHSRVAQLRPVYYEQRGPATLLADINAALKANGEPPFVPFTISHIGAFYLSSLVSSEDEVRLMVKRYKCGADLTLNDGKYDYWPIPISSGNDYCDLRLKGIHVAPNGDLSSVKKAIAGTKFATIEPTGP